MIFNMDESPVASTDTHTGRSKVLRPVGLPSTHVKAKKAQTHTTYVACMSACEYDRPALVKDGRVLIPEVKAHDGTARPGMVRIALLCGVVLAVFEHCAAACCSLSLAVTCQVALRVSFFSSTGHLHVHDGSPGGLRAGR